MERERNVEIENLTQFDKIRSEGVGYIIITDSANPNKIHTVDCRTITEDRFYEKVIRNKCRNGHYYWTDDTKQMKRFSAVPCSVCKPTIPERQRRY